jgi:hypothetical protein
MIFGKVRLETYEALEIRNAKLQEENAKLLDHIAVLDAEHDATKVLLHKSRSRNQWLLLQLGLLGYEPHEIPEVPAKPARTVLRKAPRRR